MKRNFKGVLSLLLAAVMIFGSLSVGFTDIDLPDLGKLFTQKAEAATSGYYTYTVSNGEATITDVDTSISGNITIPSTLGGYPVTSIGDHAFEYCRNLTSITIPESVTSIGYEAFFFCDSLISTEIPDSVTSIGSYAFDGCTSLTSITIPDSVTSIGANAFYCTGLTKITVNSANKIYSNDNYGVLFNKNKTELIQYPIGNTRTSYTIPNSVTNIKSEAFRDCDNLSSVTIPDSVTSIGLLAFYHCHSLTKIIVDSVNKVYSSDNHGVLFNKNKTELIQYPIGNTRTSYTIPNSVTSIGNCAFTHCDTLTSITIPDSVTSIDWGAFDDCDSLTSITIGNSVTSIGYGPFSSCDSLESITVNPTNTAYSCDEYGVLFNKNKTELIQYPIGNRRTSYVIPDSVTSIGQDAFYHCKSLTSITIPDSVTSIGPVAFYGCENITDIYYTGTEEEWNEISIGYNNTDLTNATIYFVELDIYTYTVDENGNATITDVDESISGDITIPSTLDGYPVRSIGDYAFSNCIGLTRVIIPEGVTSVCFHSFSNCSSIKEILLPDGLQTIESGAFGGCTNLESINIPKSVTHITGSDFTCYTIFSGTKLYNNPQNWADDILYIDDCLIYSKNKNAKIEIREGTRLISGSAFIYSDASEIVIPDSVEIINNTAFYVCNNLMRITIPQSVREIGNHAIGYTDNYFTRSDMGPDYDKIPEFIIYCYKNTEGMNYAIENEFDYRIVGETYTLTLDANGGEFADGSTVFTAEVECGADLYDIIPGAPIMEGYTFTGWNETLPVTMPAHDITFKANYKINTYQITFDTDGGSVIAPLRQEYGTAIKSPANPVKTGYTFMGWTDEHGNPASIPATMPAYNLVFYAQWEEYIPETYTITYMVDGSVYHTAVYEENELIEKFSVSGREGITFKGWTPALPIYMPARDLVVNAVWELNHYTFTLDANGGEFADGSSLFTAEVEYGASLAGIMPDDASEREGYSFIGWIDENGNAASIPETMPAANLTFYAVWEEIIPETYTVTWIVDGVSRTENYEVGATITAPADPVKTGYTFVGWTPAVPAVMPANDLTFTAVWEEIPEENIYNLGEETYSFVNPTYYEDCYRCFYGQSGHCFGMSVTSSGYYTGILDMSITGANEEQNLYDLALTPEVQLPLCVFQARQGYSNDVTIAGGTHYKTSTINIEKDWQEVVNYVKNHEFDGKGSLQIGFRGEYYDYVNSTIGWGGHAVNFIRYEEVNGQPRIYIYDNNFPFTETYLYKDSNGKIKQAPYETFDVSIFSVALRDVNKYFELVADYDSSRYIYAERDSVNVVGVEAYVMDCGTEGMVMFEIPDGVEKVNIIPLEENASLVYLDQEYSFGKVDGDTVGIFTLSSTDDSFGGGQTPGLEIINEPSVKPEINAEIRRPSTTTISYGDSIILHADIDGELPNGYYVKWTASNGNFSYKADGATCTITPSKSGDTTFTATIYDAEDNPVSTDEQTMTSKAGFFDKIIAFFKGIFGLTKTIPDVFKF